METVSRKTVVETDSFDTILIKKIEIRIPESRFHALSIATKSGFVTFVKIHEFDFPKYDLESLDMYYKKFLNWNLGAGT